MTAAYIFNLDDTVVDKSIYKSIYNDIINALLDNLKIDKIKLQELITQVKFETGNQKVDSYELCKALNATEVYFKVIKRKIKHTYSIKTKAIPTIFRKIYAQDKKIGIISEAKEHVVKLFLKHFHLFEYITFIHSGDPSSVLFWVTLEKKFDLSKETTMVVDNDDSVLEVAKHAGYKVLNVKDIDDIEGFNY